MSKITHTHCCYCRRKFSETVELLKKTVDHFWPSSRTGHNSPENKLSACLECNRWKADLMPADWLKMVQRHFKRQRRYGTYSLTDYGQIIGSLKHFLRAKKGQNLSDYKL